MMSTKEIMEVSEAIYKHINMEVETMEEAQAVLSFVSVLIQYDFMLKQTGNSATSSVIGHGI